MTVTTLRPGAQADHSGESDTQARLAAAASSANFRRYRRGHDRHGDRDGTLAAPAERVRVSGTTDGDTVLGSLAVRVESGLSETHVTVAGS